MKYLCKVNYPENEPHTAPNLKKFTHKKFIEKFEEGILRKNIQLTKKIVWEKNNLSKGASTQKISIRDTSCCPIALSFGYHQSNSSF